jgi:hypothetical protein
MAQRDRVIALALAAFDVGLVIFTPGLVLRQPIAVSGANVGGEGRRLSYVPRPATAVRLFGTAIGPSLVVREP